MNTPTKAPRTPPCTMQRCASCQQTLTPPKASDGPEMAVMLRWLCRSCIHGIEQHEARR